MIFHFLDHIEIELTLEFWGYKQNGEKTREPLEIRKIYEIIDRLDSIRIKKEGGRYLVELADKAVRKLRARFRQKKPDHFWISNHQCFSWNYFLGNRIVRPETVFPAEKVVKITGKNFFRPKIEKQPPKEIFIKNRIAWRNFVQLKKKKSRKRKNRQKNRNIRLGLVRPDRTGSDQTRPDQTRPDQTRPDQTMDQSATRIKME